MFTYNATNVTGQQETITNQAEQSTEATKLVPSATTGESQRVIETIVNRDSEALFVMLFSRRITDHQTNESQR